MALMHPITRVAAYRSPTQKNSNVEVYTIFKAALVSRGGFPFMGKGLQRSDPEVYSYQDKK